MAHSERPSSFARGVRTPYAELPVAVRTWVEEHLGGPPVRVRDQVGGFSPGTAAIVASADGAVFVKAVGAHPNRFSLELYRTERHQLAALPEHPAIPRLLASTDLVVDGVDWVVTLFPALPGRTPQHPWTTAEADVVFGRLADLQRDLRTAEAPELPAGDDVAAFLSRWEAVLTDPDDPWSVRSPAAAAAVLAAQERVGTACGGEAIVHVDLRADNVLVDGDRVWFVDWVAARRAAAWLDPALLAADLVISGADRAEGGEIDLRHFVEAQPGIDGHDRFVDLVVALGGALHWLSRRPAPDGLPTIRAWQHGCAERLIGYAGRHRAQI